MDNRFVLLEKAIYRAINTVFLVSIAVFATGKYLGIVSANILHGIVVIVVLMGLIAIEYCSIKGKLFSILCLFGITSSVVAVVGTEKIWEFLSSYGRWFIGKGTWEKEWLIAYELMQVVWIVLFCYVLQMLLEKVFRVKIELQDKLSYILLSLLLL